MKINKGFTLIELMIVVAIVSITLGIGLPSFQSIIASNRLTSAANAMVSALQLARMEALKQHNDVVIRPKNGTTNNWLQGWEVFVDSSTNNHTKDTDEVIFATFGAIGSTVRMDSVTHDAVYYNSSGRINAAWHITFCSPSTGTATDYRKVEIELTGRVKVTTPPSCS